MSDIEKKVIEGSCEEITEKNGWTTFSINIGRQYPVRLNTKLPQVIEAARSIGNQRASWTFEESEGSLNPNSGKPYINRRLESVQKIVPVSGDAAPSSPVSDSKEEVDWDGKNKRIARQACLKAAAAIVVGLDVTDPALETIKIAERFETWVYRGFDSVPFEPEGLPGGFDDSIPF